MMLRKQSSASGRIVGTLLRGHPLDSIQSHFVVKPGETPQQDLLRGFFLLAVAGVILIATFSSVASAQNLQNYQKRVHQAVTALDTLAQKDEDESPEAYFARVTATVERVRTALPETEAVDANGTQVTIDNRWLHEELGSFEKLTPDERTDTLARVIERLRAIADRMLEAQEAAAQTLSKDEANARLREILARPEYATKKSGASALGKLLKQLVEWFASLFPKRQASAGGVPWISAVLQYVVILLALGVIGYVIKLVLPRIARRGRIRQKQKRAPRIVLGEHLEPDQSVNDLLSEAETLARKGELRAAIRKAYIALLVELGERKVLSLAQHKTNRDYLRALREVQPLYLDVTVLTDSFERHWYGLAQATEADWLAFRAGYRNALS